LLLPQISSQARVRVRRFAEQRATKETLILFVVKGGGAREIPLNHGARFTEKK
jgi:hypothetical protein